MACAQVCTIVTLEVESTRTLGGLGTQQGAKDDSITHEGAEEGAEERPPHSTHSRQLLLVDLGGSERSERAERIAVRDRTQVSRNLLDIVANINLCDCINRATELKQNQGASSRMRCIPHRNSKLTMLLHGAGVFGGGCETVFLGTVVPTDACYEETIATARFLKRADNMGISTEAAARQNTADSNSTAAS